MSKILYVIGGVLTTLGVLMENGAARDVQGAINASTMCVCGVVILAAGFVVGALERIQRMLVVVPTVPYQGPQPAQAEERR